MKFNLLHGSLLLIFKSFLINRWDRDGATVGFHIVTGRDFGSRCCSETEMNSSVAVHRSSHSSSIGGARVGPHIGTGRVFGSCCCSETEMNSSVPVGTHTYYYRHRYTYVVFFLAVAAVRWRRTLLWQFLPTLTDVIFLVNFAVRRRRTLLWQFLPILTDVSRHKSKHCSQGSPTPTNLRLVSFFCITG